MEALGKTWQRIKTKYLLSALVPYDDDGDVILKADQHNSLLVFECVLGCVNTCYVFGVKYHSPLTMQWGVAPQGSSWIIILKTTTGRSIMFTMYYCIVLFSCKLWTQRKTC